jgi:hypothetical protein
MARLGYSEDRVAEMTPERVQSIVDAHLALDGKRPGGGNTTSYVARRRKNK